MTSKEGLYKLARERGWKVIEELPDDYSESTPFYCEDNDGFRYRTNSNNLYNKKGSHKIHKTNKYSLYNIQHYLDIHNLNFTLLDKEYVSNNHLMNFKCNRCGTTVQTKWTSIIRTYNDKIGRLICPMCDGVIESQHATVLKQIFLHEYPDTIVEERSCINPDTGCAMPTDIVNHKLRIAIEIQSQWHDYRIDRDKIKKDFWIKKGYNFYAPDIRDYSILEMCQLFFNIQELPDYIDFSKGKKLDIINIQKELDKYISPMIIAETFDISPHRIYDAIQRKVLHYPDDYKPSCYSKVVQFDMQLNKIGIYSSITMASKISGVNKYNIASCLYRNNNYSGGYYWQRYEDYIQNKEIKCYKKP